EMIWELVSKPFRRAGEVLARAFEANSLASARMQAAQEVAQMTDEELEDLGMSRAFAIQVALRSFT
ncbi:MAG: DUF1127 domain-containing protein, partial [Pseudomonadota bacterium]